VAIKAPGSELRRVEAAIASAMVAIKAPLFVQGPVEAAIAAIAADISKTNSETKVQKTGMREIDVKLEFGEGRKELTEGDTDDRDTDSQRDCPRQPGRWDGVRGQGTVGACSLANGSTPVLPHCPARTGMDRDTLRTPDDATSRSVHGEGWNCFLEPTKAVKARRSKSSTKSFTPAPNTVKRPRLSRGEKPLGGTRLVKATQRPTMDAKKAVEKTRVVLETPPTPFVFEEPKQSYLDLDFGERQALLLKGEMAAERLVYMKRVHVVLQPLFKTQVTVAKRLDLPHYQAKMSTIVASKFSSIIYYDEDSPPPEPDDSFLYMRNKHSAEVDILMASIDFHAIGRRLLLRKPTQSVRQSFYEDFGFCAGQNTSRRANGNPVGVAKPREKPGTRDELIRGLLSTCSSVLRTMDFPIFNFGGERLRTFAGGLAEGNTIEALRLAITDETNLCGVHEDRRNDAGYPTVPVFSKFIFLQEKKYRVSIIMYSRKSIADYMNRKNSTYGPAVTFVLDAFSQIPAERRYVLPRSFPKRGSETIDCHGMHCSSLPCHMDPSFFVSPVIHFGLMLAFRHLLDFAEMVSVFRAWAAMPYTSYYFCSAIILLLQQRQLPVRGLLLGRFLLILMVKQREEHQSSKTKIPGFRFSTYRKVVIPGKEEWVESTTELVRLCLVASFRQDAPGEKKERAAFYEKTRKAVANEIPNAGGLVSNHLMAVLAIVGIVPLWFGDEHTVDTSTKPMQFLVEKQGLVKGKPAAQRFLDSLTSALESEDGFVFTRRYSENVCCKVFRLYCTVGSDCRYSDLVFENQCIFQNVGGRVRIHRLGFRTLELGGALIDRWALGGRLWFLPQLILQFGSTAKDGFKIPKELGLKAGDSRIAPAWVDGFFPDPFVVKDLRKAQATVQHFIEEL
jgi:hypothetical protein